MTREEFADVLVKARELLTISGAYELRLEKIPFVSHTTLSIKVIRDQPRVVGLVSGVWGTLTRQAVLAGLDEIIPGRRAEARHGEPICVACQVPRTEVRGLQE